MTFNPSALSEIQIFLKKNNLDALYVPKHDRFYGEYIQPCDEILKYISQFSGSLGFSVITQNQAFLWIDGRYTLQAKQETDPDSWTLLEYGKDTLQTFLKNNSIQSLAFDPWLVNIDQYHQWEQLFEETTLHPLNQNWIDIIWKDRPSRTSSPIFEHKLEYAGLSVQDKMNKILPLIDKPYLIHKLDNLCWLLNIRGSDVPCTPLVLGTAILNPNGHVDLFLDCQNKDISNLTHLKGLVTVHPFENLNNLIHSLTEVFVHDASTPYALALQNEEKLIPTKDYITPLKAIKNQTEQQGMKDAHISDAVAVIETLYWLDMQDKETLTEIDVSDFLLERRKEKDLFISPSFETISGSGPNAAIVHYHATEKSNRSLKTDRFLLLDSGGQYLNGTTDITRTICINPPTNEEKNRFTEVLKGNIALSSIVFPKGTTGAQLDVLARQYLWKNGLDFKHGTGHGVGCFLNVHEGPQSISPRSHVPLEAGMVVSNEPGYYKDNDFGIRHENLELIVESEHEGFLKFETLTLVPFDRRAINKDMLTESEIKWLLAYRDKIMTHVYPKLLPKIQEWLLKQF